jgi:acetylglutamate kinase
MKAQACCKEKRVKVTIKLGGSILEDVDIRTHILAQISRMASRGYEVILVHGGGKSLNRRLSQLQMKSQFIEGLRVTDVETLGVAVMVLAGEVNKKIVAEMSHLGTRALGICGADGNAVRCISMAGLPGYPEGIGFVGKPDGVDRSFFEMILSAGIVPVVSSIALGPDSQLYNINADQMAAACATGTRCDSLIYLTDVPGVKDGNGVVRNSLGKSDIIRMRSEGILSGGMLPKTSSCLEAIEMGVESVHILPGASPDILAKFTDGSLSEGTKIHGN